MRIPFDWATFSDSQDLCSNMRWIFNLHIRRLPNACNNLIDFIRVNIDDIIELQPNGKSIQLNWFVWKPFKAWNELFLSHQFQLMNYQLRDFEFAMSRVFGLARRHLLLLLSDSIIDRKRWREQWKIAITFYARLSTRSTMLSFVVNLKKGK